MSEYPVKRDLDGVYFRIKRDEHYQAVCFSDLTKEEREAVLEGKNITIRRTKKCQRKCL